MIVRQSVKQNDFSTLQNLIDLSPSFRFRQIKFQNINEADTFPRLHREMQSQIRLGHGCDGMLAEGGVAVQPMNRSRAADAVAGEMLTKNRVAPERRRGNEERNE